MARWSRDPGGSSHLARARTATLLLISGLSVVSVLGGQPILAATAAFPAAPQSGGTPVPANDANRGDAVTPKTAAWDKHFDRRRSAFLPERSDARYAVYRNPDGTETVRLSVDDRLVPNGQGGWRPLDLALTTGAEGRLQPRAALESISFAPTPSTAVARLSFGGGALDFSVPGSAPGVAAIRQPAAAGELIRYEGALPGRSTLELASLSRGYQASVIAVAPVVAGALLQQMRIPPGYRVRETNGVLQIMDTRNSEVATWSGERATVPGIDATGTPMQLRLVGTNGSTVTVRAVIDAAWLAQRTRGQEVRITTTVLASTQPLRAAAITAAGSASGSALVVGSQGGNAARALLGWPVALPTGSKLLAATLSLYNTGASSCTPTPFEVRQLTGPFDSSTSWANASKPSATVETSAQAAAGAPGCASPEWVSLQMTDVVRGWLNRSSPNFGVSVQAANQHDRDRWTAFAGPMTATAPLLDVTYQAPKSLDRSPVSHGFAPGPQPPINISTEITAPKALPASAGKTDSAGKSEIVPERTAKSKTFVKPDKTKVTQLYEAPIHMRDASGAWVDIDTSLVPAAPGRVGTKATEHPLTAAVDQTDPGLVRLTLDPSHEVAFGFAGASAGHGTTAGDAIRYSEIAPGVDLEVVARPAGLEDNIILKSATAPDTYLFPLRLKGLNVTLEASTGDLVFHDSVNGAEIARTPTGLMEDANVDPHSGLGARSLGVTYNLVGYQGGTAIRVKLDRKWLNDPARKFPVRVDPPVGSTVNTAEDDTYVASNYVGDFAGQTEFYVGTWDGGVHLYHSYMHFDFSGLNGKHILGANFYVYEHWSWSCQARGVGVYRVSQGWGGHSMTGWPGASYAEEIAWAAFAHGYNGNCPAAWQGFDITGAVQNWTNGAWPQYGLMIREDTVSTSDNFAWKRFWTYNYGNGVTPHVDVAWKDRPSAATLSSPANTALLNTSTPTLSAAASSPQGYPLTYHYYVCDSLANAQQVQVANVGTVITGCTRYDRVGALTIPLNTLLVDTPYWWAVLVDDGDYNLQSPTIWTFRAGVPPINVQGKVLTPPTTTAAGSQMMTVTNHTASTWGSGYVASYHLMSSDGKTEITHQGHQTPLPSALAPEASVDMAAVIDPVSPGSYTLAWEMEQTPSTWFYPPVPITKTSTPFTTSSPPVISQTSPATGSAVPSLTPTLSVTATDPQGKAMTYLFRICSGSDANSGACTDSGSITSSLWTVPKSKLSWSTTYYWIVYASNGSGTAASAVSAIQPKLPVVQPAWSFGWDPYASFSGGVNTALGNYVTSTTDVSVATVGPSLQLTRTFNSLDVHTGWFGKGWTSTYETWIEISTDSYKNATIHYSDGRLEFHSNNQDGSFADALGFAGTLTGSATAGYTLTSPDHSQLAFNGASGRLASSTDSNGRTLTLSYSASSPTQLLTVTDATSGRALHLAWIGSQPGSISTDAPATGVAALTTYYGYTAGQLTSICDGRSASASDTTYCTALIYTNGQLTKITEPRGNVGLALSYDGSGRVATLQDGMTPPNQWSYAYAASPVSGEAKQTTVTDARGNATVSGYNSLDQLMRHVDEEGRTRTYGFDARGFVNLVTNESGRSVTYNHDSRGNIGSQVDAAGHTTFFDYYLNANPGDLRNDRLIGQRDPRSSSAQDPTYLTTFDYDTKGNRIRQTTPPTPDVAAGAVTVWTYSDGSATFPAFGGGNTPAGLLMQIQDPRRNLTNYSYDVKGDLRQLTDKVGLVTTYAYDNIGRRISQTVMASGYPNGLTTQYAFDALGGVTSVSEPPVTNTITGVTHTKTTTITCDRNANTASVVVSDATGGDASRTTTYTYDADDRLSTVTNPENGTITRYYDQNGNQSRVIDQAGRETDTSYTARNLPSAVTLKAFVDNPVTPSTPRDVVLARYTYDVQGRRATATDALGRQQVYDWFADDQLKQVTLPNYHNLDGTTRTVVLGALTYDAAGNITSATAGTPGSGYRVTGFSYDAAGYLKTSTQDPGGLNRVTTLTYDAAGNVVGRSLSDGTVTESMSFGYDAAGHLTQQSVNNGTSSLLSTTSYDNRGLPIASVEPRGNVTGGTPAAYETHTTYDVAGRVVTSVAPGVAVESSGGAATQVRPTGTMAYDTFGDVLHAKNANGYLTTSTFDRLSRRKTVSYPTYTTPATATSPGGAVLSPVESWTYDAVGNVLNRTDQRGQSVDYVYDARNRLVQRTDPLVSGQTARGLSSLTYDDASNVLSTVNPIGARTEMTYDDRDRLRSATQVVRGTTTARYTATYDYNDLGNGVLTTSPLGEKATSIFDNLGELTQQTDANGIITNYAYDLAGRLRRTTDALGRATENVYDLAGRLTTVKNYDHTGGLLTQSQAGYDPAGNATSIASPNAVLGGYATTRVYDAMSRLTSIIEPVSATNSITTSFGYDSAGHQTRVTDGNGHATIKTYNSLGLLESTIEPSTAAYPAAADRTYTVTYDAGGLPVTYNPPGVTISRTFDQLGRPTQESGSGTGVTTATRTFSWDLAGHLSSFSHPKGTTTLTIDDRGLITAASGPSDSSTFSYDGDGRVSARTDAAGTASFTYFGDGLLKTATDPLTAATLSYSYDAAAQLQSTTTGTAASTRTFTHDDLGRVTGDTLGDPANPAAATHTVSYSYDANSNRIATAIGPTGLANGAAYNFGYAYDRADRLTSWIDKGTNATVTYGWDGAGNRVSVGAGSASFDERNRMVSDTSGTTYAWTARGTMASSTAASVVTNYGFDGLGQMTTDAPNTTYAYDGLGRLATKTVVTPGGGCYPSCVSPGGSSRSAAAPAIPGPPRPVPVVTTLKYAGAEPKPVSDGTYSYSRLPSGRLLGMNAGTSARLAGLDLHGDLTFTYNSAGAIVDAASYDPFGTPRAAFPSGGPTVGYQGEWSSNGNVDMSARWYKPGTATFISRDPANVPVAAASDTNRYLYTGANPITRADPSGLYWDITFEPHQVCLIGNFICHTEWKTNKKWIEDWPGQPLACSQWWVPYYCAAPPTTPASNPQPPSSPPTPPTGHGSGGGSGAAGGHGSGGGGGGGGGGVAYNPGPQDQNRSAVDPNWQAHIPPYTPGQAPVAAGLPPVTASQSSQVTQSVTVANQGGGGGGGGASGPPSCNGCSQLASAIGRQAGEFAQGVKEGAVDMAKGAVGLLKLGGSCALAGIGVDLFGCGKTLKAMGTYVMQHPSDLLGQMVDWEDFSHGRIARGVGHLLPSAVLTVATFGGGGVAAKGGEITGAVAEAADSLGGSALATGAREAAGTAAGAESRGAADLAASCAVNSFSANTLILMADGSQKRIDQVMVGDRVLASDPQRGSTTAKTVQRVIVGHGLKHLYDIHVAGDLIETTYNHPFWVPDKQAFVWAQDLRPRDRVLLADGRAPPITAISHHDAVTRVFNLSITEIHTFFVGHASALVHNACGQVGYGETALSRATQAQRLADGNMANNYGAALLDDGSIIVGRSGAGVHAEESLIDQAGSRRITDIYSELEPCANNCAGLTQGMNVTWSWPWNGVDRATSQAAKSDAVRSLFGR